MYGESLCVGTRLSPDGVRLLAPPDFFLLLWILKYKKGLVALFRKHLRAARGSFQPRVGASPSPSHLRVNCLLYLQLPPVTHPAG